MLLTPLILLASMLHAGPERVITPPLPNASPYGQFVAAAAGDEGALLGGTLQAGPERAVTPPVRNGSPYEQLSVRASGSGDVALLAWTEELGSAAIRVDRDGRPLDEHPIALSGARAVSRLQIVRGRDGWLALWVAPDNILEGRFIGDDGTASFDLIPFVLGSAADDLSGAFDGTHYLVAWTHAGGSIRALRLDADGAVVEGGVEIPARGWFEEVEVVAFDGGGFAVVGIQAPPVFELPEYTVEAFRLDTNADFLSFGLVDRTSTAALGRLHVLADGGTLVSSWSGSGIVGDNTFVAREGQPVRLAVTSATPDAIVKTGGQVFVAVATALGRFTLLVSEDGTERRTVGASTIGSAATSVGERTLIAMVTERGIEYDLSTAIVDASMQEVVPQTRLEPEPPIQERPAVARNDRGESLAVWLESGRRSGPAVMGTRLDGAGRAAGPAVVLGPVSRRRDVRPQVASDGEDFLVVWYEFVDGNPGVRTVRVLRDGTVFDPVVHLFGHPQLCLAWNGAEYLLGHWRITTSGRFLQHAEVHATRFSREGVRGESMPVSPEVQFFDHLSCAASESATLFVFAGNTSVSGAVLSDGGTLTAPFPIGSTGISINDTRRGLVRTAVAANGESFVTAWSTYDNRIEWARVTEGGTASKVNAALAIDTTGRSLAVAPLRDGFLLAWQGFGDLHGLALDRDGRSVSGVTISATPRLEHEVALAGGERALAVYQRELVPEGQPRWRVFARTVGESTPRRRSARH